jgi:Ni/Co efflux regulator RcnB
VRRVRAPSFRYPGGYSYRRWNIGLILPSIFLSNSYFYNSWATVGAYPPPPGFVWVRYGPDLLLVSRRSGRIRDVIYGVFY